MISELLCAVLVGCLTAHAIYTAVVVHEAVLHRLLAEVTILRSEVRRLRLEANGIDVAEKEAATVALDEEADH